jgi:hypothetical protein
MSTEKRCWIFDEDLLEASCDGGIGAPACGGIGYDKQPFHVPLTPFELFIEQLFRPFEDPDGQPEVFRPFEDLYQIEVTVRRLNKNKFYCS